MKLSCAVYMRNFIRKTLNSKTLSPDDRKILAQILTELCITGKMDLSVKKHIAVALESILMIDQNMTNGIHF